MNKLPEWPTEPQVCGFSDDDSTRIFDMLIGCRYVKGSKPYIQLRYAQACAEAALARLRVSVDLLNSSECGSGQWCDDRDKAIANIGPLPEVS